MWIQHLGTHIFLGPILLVLNAMSFPSWVNPSILKSCNQPCHKSNKQLFPHPAYIHTRFVFIYNTSISNQELLSLQQIWAMLSLESQFSHEVLPHPEVNLLKPRSSISSS